MDCFRKTFFFLFLCFLLSWTERLFVASVGKAFLDTSEDCSPGNWGILTEYSPEIHFFMQIHLGKLFTKSTQTTLSTYSLTLGPFWASPLFLMCYLSRPPPPSEKGEAITTCRAHVGTHQHGENTLIASEQAPTFQKLSRKLVQSGSMLRPMRKHLYPPLPPLLFPSRPPFLLVWMSAPRK